MGQETSDQTKFWQAVAQAIASQTGTDPGNIMMVSKGITCNFDAATNDANGQIVDLGNTIPPWSLTWNGITNNNFFGMYQSWLDEISLSPQPGTSTTDLDAIRQKIVNYQNATQQIVKGEYKNYISNYCVNASADGMTCTTWIPGYSDKTFQTYLQTYLQSTDYQEKVANLNEIYGDDLAGLQEQYDALAEKVYGPDYRELAEAKSAVQKADPRNPNNRFPNKKAQNQYQIQVDEDGAVIWQPRYALQQGETIADFKSWLSTAQTAANNGNDPEVTVELSNSTQTDNSSSWQFSFNATIPIEDVFMVGVEGSGSQSKVDMSKYDFKATVTYQSIKNISLGPASTWYDSSMIAKYKNYAGFDKSSPFVDASGKSRVWGPQGIFNVRIASVIVAYQPWIKMEFSNWSDTETHTTWSEKVDVSILNIIHLGSESASGKSDQVQYTSTDTGFELKDNSGRPQIIALVLETLNYP